MDSIVNEAISCSIPVILTHLGYSFNCKTTVQILQRKLTDLGSMRNDIEGYVKTAKEKSDSIKSTVENWQEKVITVQDEATVLIRASQDINRWFQGWCCLARYHLGKDALEKIDNVTELINEGTKFSSASCVSDPAPLPGLLSSVDFQAFPSRESTKNEIIEALKDKKINRVGVWGMGGVGKTTLIKEVGEQVMRDRQLFDQVVMATVSQNPDLIEIQGELAKKLGVENFASGIIGARAAQLGLRLKEKKILVILDDIWRSLDVTDLGISFGDQKSCKVVFTSRNEDICNDLNTQKNIKVEELSNQDSWDLFAKESRLSVGDVVDDELARKVAKECEGMPLAIVTLGRALRGKDQHFWKDAAKRLQKSIYFQGKSPVFSSIKLSYDHLESEEIHIFLFCCFFPEDQIFNVDDLIWFVLGEELLSNVENLEDARGRLHTIFNKLVASCLLLKSGNRRGVGCVMHDIVRHAAISIAHEESNSFIVKAGLGLEAWPVMKNLGRCKRLSLIGNKISELPDQPECPQLFSLSLSSNASFTKIPDCFFERMTSLVALDLSRNKLSSLPPSLSCLVNLRTLCLEGNPLSDVSLVGELKKLEYLNLSETEIQNLPEGIGGLTNLRFLSFSKIHRLKIIPKTVLLNLSRLEELYMGIYGSLGDTEMGDESNDRLPELGSLKLLTTLHLNVVRNVKCLSQEISIFGEVLENFIITVGRRSNLNFNYLTKSMELKYIDYQRSMKLNAISDPLANWVKVLLRKTELLYLCHCRSLKNIVKLGEGGFDNLKVLQIESCNEIEYLTCVVEEDTPQITFNGLEELVLSGLNGFEVIHHGSLPNRFLGKLKILKVFQCKKIVKLFPCELLLKLQNLEVLELVRCDKLKEVFHTVGIEEGHVAIPRLREMKLINLPSLTTIWNRVIPLGSFQELNCLEVRHCKRLRYLFTRTMVQRLQRLEYLEIEECNQMKKIIKSEEDEEDEIMVEEDHQEIMIEETVVEREQDETVQFPQLKTLRLRGLQKFLGFYRPNILWPSLELLHVYDCPNLEKRPLCLQSATKLRELSGDNIEWFEGLEWEDQSLKSRLQPLFMEIRSDLAWMHIYKHLRVLYQVHSASGLNQKVTVLSLDVLFSYLVLGFKIEAKSKWTFSDVE